VTERDNQATASAWLAVALEYARGDGSPWHCEHCGERVTEESAVLLERDGVRMTSCSSCTPSDD
jgi:hypothetical protein